jgi:hypothetical protein
MERFTIKQHRDYIELFDNGVWKCNCDNRQEIEEEIQNILGY